MLVNESIEADNLEIQVSNIHEVTQPDESDCPIFCQCVTICQKKSIGIHLVHLQTQKNLKYYR